MNVHLKCSSCTAAKWFLIDAVGGCYDDVRVHWWCWINSWCEHCESFCHAHICWIDSEMFEGRQLIDSSQNRSGYDLDRSLAYFELTTGLESLQANLILLVYHGVQQCPRICGWTWLHMSTPSSSWAIITAYISYQRRHRSRLDRDWSDQQHRWLVATNEPQIWQNQPILQFYWGLWQNAGNFKF